MCGGYEKEDGVQAHVNFTGVDSNISDPLLLRERGRKGGLKPNKSKHVIHFSKGFGTAKPQAQVAEGLEQDQGKHGLHWDDIPSGGGFRGKRDLMALFLPWPKPSIHTPGERQSASPWTCITG